MNVGKVYEGVRMYIEIYNCMYMHLYGRESPVGRKAAGRMQAS